jgi:hypothetical protein
MSFPENSFFSPDPRRTAERLEKISQELKLAKEPVDNTNTISVAKADLEEWYHMLDDPNFGEADSDILELRDSVYAYLK